MHPERPSSGRPFFVFAAVIPDKCSFAARRSGTLKTNRAALSARNMSGSRICVRLRLTCPGRRGREAGAWLPYPFARHTSSELLRQLRWPGRCSRASGRINRSGEPCRDRCDPARMRHLRGFCRKIAETSHIIAPSAALCVPKIRLLTGGAVAARMAEDFS